MNQRDRANLEFLLSVGPGLADWFAQASEDDIKYAQELLNIYEQELEAQQNDSLTEDFGVQFVAFQTNYVQ